MSSETSRVKFVYFFEVAWDESGVVVQLETYKYLFPYEKVQQESKIVIYGAGILGQEYWKQIQITKYCQIIAFIDKNADRITPFGIPVYKPEQIMELSFDYVVVALRSDHFLKDVKRILCHHGVSDEAIICVSERKTVTAQVKKNMDWSEKRTICTRLAYMRSEKIPIALYIVGGIGDAIVKKRFIETIIHMVPNCAIDIYSLHELSWLYSDIQQLNELIQDNGVLYHAQCKKYILALTIKAYFIEVDFFSKNQTQGLNEIFVQKMKRLENMADVSSYPKYIVFMRHLYKGYNCYTGYSYDGIFDINDSKVHIPLLEEYEKKFYTLGLHRYITVNFGNGDSEDVRMVAKAWPLDRFEKTIALFKEQYSHIQVVQLGTKSAERIEGADRYVLGESFELVKHVLKNSIFHLDIEGGLVHLATQLGTKCIVLFGPTNEKYFGYTQNINIKVGNCHDCYGLYNDLGRCARDLSEPECMYNITPEIVMERVKEYMENTVKRDYVKYRVYIERLGLTEPLIVGLRDNASIITDLEITQNERNDGTFEIKCYLNPAAGIQSPDDIRLRFACENIIGNLSLCTKGHVGIPEYIGSSIAGKNSCIIDIIGSINVCNSQESLEKIKEQLCWNHRLNDWEVLYRMAMLSKDDVTRFILLYAIINGVLESGGQRKLQGAIDSFIRQKCREKGKNDYLEDGIGGETIYTSLRNSISHAKPEREMKPSDAYAQIHDKVAQLAEITLWAIEEVSNSVDSD